MLAHVDHGKTTLSDFLLSANGVLSEGLAGQVRFLDSRPDEQERLITMKASSVALQHMFKGERYLCNLVDSPGHIDFSCEVSTAMRLCDGGLIIVDIVDGATMQTQLMLRHALMEGLSMCLVINKLDIAIVTQGLSPEDVYLKVSEIVSSCNVALSSVISSLNISTGGEALNDRKSAIKKMIPEDEVWFSPAKGNVILTSCLEGWGFNLEYFAKLYAKKLPFSEEKLMTSLWGDHYLVGKEISTKPKKDGQPPLFVTHVLQPIHTLYSTFLAEPFDPQAAAALSEKLGIDRKRWDLPNRDPRFKLHQLLSHWLPLATCVLDLVVNKLDSPPASNQRRLATLLPSLNHAAKVVRDHLWRCSSDSDAPTVAFVAKLLDTHNVAGYSKHTEITPKALDEMFVSFGRVYSGRIRKGQKMWIHSNNTKTEVNIGNVYVLQGQGLEEVEDLPAGCLFAVSGITSHIVKSATLCSDESLPPFKPLSLMSSSIVKQTILPKNPADLPVLLKALKMLNQVDPQLELTVLPTGDHVICCAGEVHAERCVVDLQETFAPGLEFSLSEPIVTFRETIVAPSLKKRPVTVKTINGHFTITLYAIPLPAPALTLLADDSSNVLSSYLEADLLEAIATCDQKKKWDELLKNGIWACGPRKFGYLGCILVNGISAGGHGGDTSDFSVSATPTPSPSVHGAAAATASGAQSPEKVGAWTRTTPPPAASAGMQTHGSSSNAASSDNLMALHHSAEDHSDARSARSDESSAAYSARLVKEFSDAIMSGFQVGVSSGPMAEEPMYGLAFVVTAMDFVKEGANTKGMNPDGEYTSAGTLSGQIIYAVSSAVRQATLEHVTGRRLVEPVYHCVVQSSGATQGKIYATLGKRRAEILDEVLHEGSDLFHIVCHLPAVESFGLQNELRDLTHGAATAQLRMSHWALVDADPYFKPTTKEQIEELGLKVSNQNIGEILLEKVRRRKGLFKENAVVDPEKQKFSMRAS